MFELISNQRDTNIRHTLLRTGCDIPIFAAYAISTNPKELLSEAILKSAIKFHLSATGARVLSGVTGINGDSDRWFKAT